MDPRLDAVRSWLVARAAAPADAREVAAVRRMTAELRALPRPFDEDAGPVHVTASAIVTGPAGVLLVRHKRLGLWLQPGGHLDPGEAPRAAALRELGEETGLGWLTASEDPVHVDVHGSSGGHVHLDLRWHVTSAGEPRPAPGESQAVAWFAWDEAVRRADPGLSGALRRLRPWRVWQV